MPKDTFEGLDKLILDQPEFIDLNDKVEEDEKEKDEEKDKKEDLDDDKDENPKGKKKEEKEDDLIEVEEIENKDKHEDNKEVTQEELIQGWAGYFKENDVLSEVDLEGFDGTDKGLAEAFNKMKQREGLEMVDDYKSQLPDVLKYLADNWEEGVPLDELLNIKSNQIRFSAITDDKFEDSVDTQRAVQTEYLKRTTRYSDSKIEKEIQRLIDLDELKADAKESLVELKKFEAEAEENIKKETKRAKEARLEANKATIKIYEKVAKETKEVIPGIKIDEKMQAEVLNKVINPVGIDGNGNQVSYLQSLRSEDPHGFDFRANYIATLTKGFTDFSKISTAITTKATKDLSALITNPVLKNGKDNINTGGKKGVMDYLRLPQNKK